MQMNTMRAGHTEDPLLTELRNALDADLGARVDRRLKAWESDNTRLLRENVALSAQLVAKNRDAA
jgi:hypothetical protein